MSSWTEGYVAEIGYTHGYYHELNPLNSQLPLLHAGFAPPSGNCHCELGFGQGVSVNIHAAATGDAWYGTDFNPAQTAFAQGLAKVTGSDIQLFDQSFAEFAENPQLPQFDSISLHGIWSWINDENRHILVEFIRRKLKVGGLVYISYNAQPGWSGFAPLRNLMAQHAQQMSAPGAGIAHRIDNAVNFAEKLMATKPLYQAANAYVEPKLNRMKAQDRQYLAHEYFNQSWYPMYFADMQQWLNPAKLSFLCSAFCLDHLDEVNLTPEQRAFLAEIGDPVFRESTRDFMVNQQFRKDYWIKGARQLTQAEQATALRAYRVILNTPADEIPLKIKGSRGDFGVPEENFKPILNFLADHKDHSVAEIEAQAGQLSLAHIVKVLLALTGMGYVSAVQEQSKWAPARLHTDRFNQHVIQQTQVSANFRYLASPITGGGIPLSRVNLLFLCALQQGLNEVEELAKFAWTVLSSEEKGVVKDGKTLVSAEENLAELSRLVVSFRLKRLPLYPALQLLP